MDFLGEILRKMDSDSRNQTDTYRKTTKVFRRWPEVFRKEHEFFWRWLEALRVSADEPKSFEDSRSSEDFPKRPQTLSKISEDDPKSCRRCPEGFPRFSKLTRGLNTTTDAPWAISEWLLTPSASRLFHKQNLMLSDWYIQWSDRRIATIHVPCDRYFRCKMFPQRLHVETSL